MKVRKLGLLAAVAAFAAVPVAADADSPRDRATGGGQVLLDPNEPSTGALDTIAFTAQRARGAADDSTLATGQVQVNRRGTDAVKFHGIVQCLVVLGSKSEGKAYISGVVKGTEDDEDPVPFELYVVDGGQGAGERGADQMLVWYGPETEDNEADQQFEGNFTPPQEDEPCGIEEDPSSKRQVPVVGRGNVQVYDASGAAEARQQRSTKSTTSTSLLTGLR